MKKALIIVGIGFILLLVAVPAVLFLFVDEDRPVGTAGPVADALAAKIQAAVDVPAWKRVGAVKWRFADMFDHLWDRRRGLSRVRWEDHEVIFDTRSLQGIARREGQRLEGPDAEALIHKANVQWVNDSFWLFPFESFSNADVTRAIARDESGREGLLVTYHDGGVTPGDAYLWFVGDDGMPTEYRMWVQILKIGGINATWQDWTLLPTGAKISTMHNTPVLDITITGLVGGPSVADVEPGPDPFADLVALLGRPADAPAPASQPAGGG